MFWYLERRTIWQQLRLPLPRHRPRLRLHYHRVTLMTQASSLRTLLFSHPSGVCLIHLRAPSYPTVGIRWVRFFSSSPLSGFFAFNHVDAMFCSWRYYRHAGTSFYIFRPACVKTLIPDYPSHLGHVTTNQCKLLILTVLSLTPDTVQHGNTFLIDRFVSGSIYTGLIVTNLN